jgi:hypothetical protein
MHGQQNIKLNIYFIRLPSIRFISFILIEGINVVL